MGYVVEAKCLDCGKIFTIEHGGGFSFHLVRCDKCGKTKSISVDDLGKLHQRYLKGLSGSYSVETSEHDQDVKNHTSLQAISEEDYYKGINAVAGKCGCRGNYTLDAPPLCPKCHSMRIEEGETTIMYD